MQRQAFDYHLPDELIAKSPTAERSESRLLCLDGTTGDLVHESFNHILSCVEKGDLMVFNDTRVIPARLFGQKQTGGRIEVLVERIVSKNTVWAHVRSSKSPKDGATLEIDGDFRLKVIRRIDDLFELEIEGDVSILDMLHDVGHIPLPPYIDREDTELDQERYQTVYAQKEGAVAAPTAGLHFDDALLAQLKAKGVECAFVTLHVGTGTFQPVRADDIRDHVMHKEIMELDQTVCDQVKSAKARGNRVIAVGTTSVRCLETAAKSGEIKPFSGETNIFIYPGQTFNVIDALVTNFHLPESTLLMLVSAFAGYANTMTAYREAVSLKYRFFSYGDAMFITLNPDASSESVYMNWDR